MPFRFSFATVFLTAALACLALLRGWLWDLPASSIWFLPPIMLASFTWVVVVGALVALCVYGFLSAWRTGRATRSELIALLVVAVLVGFRFVPTWFSGSESVNFSISFSGNVAHPQPWRDRSLLGLCFVAGLAVPAISRRSSTPDAEHSAASVRADPTEG